ncbi:hypothetical protein AAVH_12721 [Aphelenchoides avenae]|nr:hypothetical protein AAVH_12721 [Aphelenchus avenae]
MLPNEALGEVALFLDLRGLGALILAHSRSSAIGLSCVENLFPCRICCAWLPKLYVPGECVTYDFAYWEDGVLDLSEQLRLSREGIEESTRILLRNCRIDLLIFQCRCTSPFDRRPCIANAVAEAAKFFIVTGTVYLDITQCGTLSTSESLMRFLGSFHKFMTVSITDDHKLWSDETSSLADNRELVAFCRQKGLQRFHYDGRDGDTKLSVDFASPT